ncbi:lantibiotic dehydratase [Spirillospora sp. NPDC000708]
MTNPDPLYRPAPGGLLRAVRSRAQALPLGWPDLTGAADPEGWAAWLRKVWTGATAEAIGCASPSLTRRVEEILAGKEVPPRQIRRAVVSVTRYLLREASRPTPFGLFAGVADVDFGRCADVRWGSGHRVLARPDAEWLNDIITGLERCSALLERLPVVISTLRQAHGDRLSVPSGAGRVEIRHTRVISSVEALASTPVPFADLAAQLSEEFPRVATSTVTGMLAELVEQRVLVTALRPPATVADPLGYLVAQLRRVHAGDVDAVAGVLAELEEIGIDLARHNGADPAGPRDAGERAAIETRIRGLSAAGRSPLMVELRLDCRVRLPDSISREMAAATSALIRLSPQPGGFAAWRQYHEAFLDHYGTGTLVPLTDVLAPGTGLGLPGGYPGSPLPEPPASVAAQNRPIGRDAALLALAHRAVMDGTGEVVLDDAAISALGADMDQVRIPAHVELTARIHATGRAALDRGEYTLTVAPARAAGTMTGRFVRAASPLGAVFAAVPTMVDGAIAAQVSTPMAYPHADNIASTSQFLPHLIPLGEHRPDADARIFGVQDLAVTADFDQLYLVAPRLGRVVEPHVFHALRLDKQPPPLARFLVALVRGRAATLTEFDWGPAAELPYLPRVRYRRSVLAAARWRITAADLPAPDADWEDFRGALERWRRRWRAPQTVELREDDRVLRLDLDEPTHTVILRRELARTGHAQLVEAADPAGDGWLDGHPHQVAVPMLSTRPPAPSPLRRGRLVPLTNTAGQFPGAAGTRWLSARLYAPPGLQTVILAEHLPCLLTDLGDLRDGEHEAVPVWWLRYRDPADPDHLRIRVRVGDQRAYGAAAAAIGSWADVLRRRGLARRLQLDTYQPEVGRYGAGRALEAAERVFVADSALVQAQLALPPGTAEPPALAAANITEIAAAFTGDTESGMDWLINRPTAAPDEPPGRDTRADAVALATGARPLPAEQTATPLWEARRTALTAYRRTLSGDTDLDQVLASLLHMHHIRAIGPNRPAERQGLHLARAAAMAWRARAPQP